jgi:hypothetical protein
MALKEVNRVIVNTIIAYVHRRVVSESSIRASVVGKRKTF